MCPRHLMKSSPTHGRKLTDTSEVRWHWCSEQVYEVSSVKWWPLAILLQPHYSFRDSLTVPKCTSQVPKYAFDKTRWGSFLHRWYLIPPPSSRSLQLISITLFFRGLVLLIFLVLQPYDVQDPQTSCGLQNSKEGYSPPQPNHIIPIPE